MIHKAILIDIIKVRVPSILSIRKSALFINGPKATDTFVYITPHIDFPERIKHKNDIEGNLARRKLNFDLNKLENLWAVFEDLKSRKLQLEQKKFEKENELATLLKNKSDTKQVELLKIQNGIIKRNINKLKLPYWSAEEAAIVESLKLPNVLHTQTPSHNKVIYVHKSALENDKNHLKIGRELDILEFTKQGTYYLKGSAAIFELGAEFYFSNILKKNGFVQFSNPDFVKSIIVEGCGFDHRNPKHTFILHHNEDSEVKIDNRLHLTGGASSFSFFAYHAKNVVHEKVLPLRYFSMGRQYSPCQSENLSLFNTSQSSVISIFLAMKTNNDCDAILDELIHIYRELYSNFGIHFRLNLMSADKLHMWESLRIAIEMYSSSLQSYVEVGNISVSGDFISKRLMFTYKSENNIRYPYVISGTILNVPKFIGCVLEDSSEFLVPSQFTVSSWSI